MVAESSIRGVFLSVTTPRGFCIRGVSSMLRWVRFAGATVDLWGLALADRGWAVLEVACMRRRKMKSKLALALVVGGGVLFGAGVGACTSFGGEALLGAVDFCFLFDCVDGAIGGLIKPCDNVGSVNELFITQDPTSQLDGGFGSPLFTDCF